MEVPAKLRAHAGELRVAFNKMDKDGDGFLSKGDLHHFLNEKIGKTTSMEEISDIISEINGCGASKRMKSPAAPVGESASIDYPAFLAFVERQLQRPLSDQLGEIFEYVDRNKDGKVTPEDVEAFAKSLDINLNIDGATQLLESGGDTQNGTDFESFCKLVSKSLPTVTD